MRMENQKPYKKKISITIDEDLYDKINVLAQEEDRNLSNYINTVLRKRVNESSYTQRFSSEPVGN